MSFMTLVFQDMRHKWKWLSRLGSHGSEILHFSLKTWYPKFWTATFLQLHVLKSWQWLHYLRLGFPSLETFCCIDFQQYNKDFCLSWLGLPRHEHKLKWLSRLGSCRSEILTPFFHDLACQVLKRCIVATPCPHVLTMVALFKAWLSKSSNFSG